MIANITATLEISRTVGNEGKEVIPEFEVINAFVRLVTPNWLSMCSG
jgi:hypothetical protein